jgi:hypothetical protein
MSYKFILSYQGDGIRNAAELIGNFIKTFS